MEARQGALPLRPCGRRRQGGGVAAGGRVQVGQRRPERSHRRSGERRELMQPEPEPEPEFEIDETPAEPVVLLPPARSRRDLWLEMAAVFCIGVLPELW